MKKYWNLFSVIIVGILLGIFAYSVHEKPDFGHFGWTILMGSILLFGIFPFAPQAFKSVISKFSINYTKKDGLVIKEEEKGS